MADTYYYGLGRRKEAIAKVRLFEGLKDNVINDKPALEFIADVRQYEKIFEPLKLVGADKKYGFTVITRGGGVSSQSEAIRLGVAKALLEIDPEYRTTLKANGYLSRDSRAKERKKPGLRGARRSPQFSKR